MSVPRWLVLGLGNPLMGADGFGPAVLDRLNHANDLPENVELGDAHTDLLAQLHRFPNYDGVLLVDAVLDPRGGVCVVDEETFAQWEDRSPGAHQLSAVMAVQLFRALQKAGAVDVAPRDVGRDRTLSPGRSAPAITLVAHLVGEEDFQRPPNEEDIEAGVDAVQRIISSRPNSRGGIDRTPLARLDADSAGSPQIGRKSRDSAARTSNVS